MEVVMGAPLCVTAAHRVDERQSLEKSLMYLV